MWYRSVPDSGGSGKRCWASEPGNEPRLCAFAVGTVSGCGDSSERKRFRAAQLSATESENGEDLTSPLSMCRTSFQTFGFYSVCFSFHAWCLICLILLRPSLLFLCYCYWISVCRLSRFSSCFNNLLFTLPIENMLCPFPPLYIFIACLGIILFYTGCDTKNSKAKHAYKLNVTLM